MIKKDNKSPPKDRVSSKEKRNLPVDKKPPYTLEKILYDSRLPFETIF